MNKALKLTLIPLAALALFAGGCASVPTTSHAYLGTTPCSPTTTASIRILREAPKAAYVSLGEIRAEPCREDLSNAKIEEALKLEAAKLGADAIILKSDKMEITGAASTGPRWGRAYDKVMDRVIVAVAIKYST